MISELSLLPPFKSLWYYRQHLDTPEFQEISVPVIDLEYYPNEGNNWNNMAFYSISRQYMEDALTVLKLYPVIYFHSLLNSCRIYFFPSSDWFHFFPSIDNIKKISSIENVYNRVLYGQFLNFTDSKFKRENHDKYFGNPLNMGIFLMGSFFLSVIYGIYLIVISLIKKKFAVPFTLTIAFIIFNILYVTSISNSLEIGENERFRFNIDPFIMILTGLFLQVCLKKLCQIFSYHTTLIQNNKSAKRSHKQKR